ncbi:hypothetical protein ACLOJK_035135 [Asimina triloba]
MLDQVDCRHQIERSRSLDRVRVDGASRGGGRRRRARAEGGGRQCRAITGGRPVDGGDVDESVVDGGDVDSSSMDGLDRPIQASPAMEKEQMMLERING